MTDERDNLHTANPFITGTTVPPELFYGRGEQRRFLKDRIGAEVPSCASVVGFRRSGDWREKASSGLLTLVVASLRPLHEIYHVRLFRACDSC